MTYRLFIDDERDPPDDGEDWVIARSYEQAILIMDHYDCPYYVSFDHDLGEQKSGHDVAKWMTERDIDRSGSWIPLDFDWYVHSQNPVGARNINNLLNNYLETQKKFYD